MDPSSPAAYLFTQGVLGVVVVVLALAFAGYYKASESQKRDDAKIIFDLQNARLQDSKDITKEVTDVLRDNSQNLRILSEKIEVGKSIERNR